MKSGRWSNLPTCRGIMTYSKEIIDNTEAALEDLRARFPTQWRPLIGCDIGWDNLLMDLRNALVVIDPDFEIAQIKEKFGGLRFYATPGSELSEEEIKKFFGIIRDAENLSFTICERTGGPGVLMRKIGGGWLKTLDSSLPGVSEQWMEWSNDDK